MHNYYGKIVWEIGSIFIGGGLAFIGFAASEPKTYPFFGATRRNREFIYIIDEDF